MLTAICARGVFRIPKSLVCLITIAVEDNAIIPPITKDAFPSKPSK